MKKLTNEEAETLINKVFSQYLATHEYLFVNGFCYMGVTKPPQLTHEFINFFKNSLKKKGVIKNG